MLQRTQMKVTLKILHGWRSAALTLATLLVVSALPVPAAAAGTPYGSGAYSSSNYNGTTTSNGSGTSTAGAPNTGEGLYSPGQSSTKSSHTVNWIELAGGAVLVVAGISVFWLLAMRRRRSPECNS